MKVYHAPDTRPVRVVWRLEELLGVPCEIGSFKLGDAGMRSPASLKINPMGRVPTLEDGAVRLSGSGAIVEYVLARHGEGRMAADASSPEFPPLPAMAA